MRIWIAQRAETIVVFLAGGIPQSKLDVLAIYFNIGDIVFKHGRYVNLRLTVRMMWTLGAREHNNLGECAL